MDIVKNEIFLTWLRAWSDCGWQRWNHTWYYVAGLWTRTCTLNKRLTINDYINTVGIDYNDQIISPTDEIITTSIYCQKRTGPTIFGRFKLTAVSYLLPIHDGLVGMVGVIGSVGFCSIWRRSRVLKSIPPLLELEFPERRSRGRMLLRPPAPAPAPAPLNNTIFE